MSQLKTMTQKWFEEMETFELPTVVRECPTEAAEAVTDLRKEVRALQAELTKEREDNRQLCEELEFIRPMVSLNIHDEEGNEPNEG